MTNLYLYTKLYIYLYICIIYLYIIYKEYCINPKLIAIRLLLDHSVWSEYRQYIKLNDDKHLETLYEVLDRLMDSGGISISLDEFKVSVELLIDSQSEKNKEIYHAYLDLLTKAEINNIILKDILTTIKQRDIAEKLATVSFEFVEGHKGMEDIKDVYEKFDSVKEELEEIEFVNDDIEEIYAKTVATPGLRWRLGCLNKSIGSIRKGNFGFIFARPETGKTTFLASEATYMAEQASGPVLWFNNEQEGSEVIIRCYQAALGVTVDELMGNRQETRRKYYEVTKRNLRIFDDASIYKRQVEDICSRLAPQLVIFDQIDKIKGFDGDREDLRLGNIYIWARELAKQYCPVIGVCQADGTAEGVKWLNMNHVVSAKTSKQAEADFIIGIGKTNDSAMEYVRHINISKNKLRGDADSIAAMRHGHMDVIIEPQIARYKDVLND